MFGNFCRFSKPKVESDQPNLKLRFHVEDEGAVFVITVFDRETGEHLGTYQVARNN